MSTDPEKLVRFRRVREQFPESEWAEKAKIEIQALRARMLGQNLAEIRSAAQSGKPGFREAMPRLDRLRLDYGKEKEALKAIDALEMDLHRSRLVARTKDLGEALRLHKPKDGPERFRDFPSPEAFRKNGEAWVMFWTKAALDVFTGWGGRLESVEVSPEGVAVQARQTGVVPVKLVLHNRLKGERTNARPSIHWIWQEGDWYLGENWLQPEGTK